MWWKHNNLKDPMLSSRVITETKYEKFHFLQPKQKISIFSRTPIPPKLEQFQNLERQLLGMEDKGAPKQAERKKVFKYFLQLFYPILQDQEIHTKKNSATSDLIQGAFKTLDLSPKIQRISEIYKGEILVVVFSIFMVLKDICVVFYAPSLAHEDHTLLQTLCFFLFFWGGLVVSHF